ncbi:MAG: NAD(P)/FAD-dependent oxidoreductase [Alphaproteobacteria bacterium]
MNETPRMLDAVIVGAGIAGLAAAWALRHRDILVLESSDRVGGKMMSLPREPYWLNLGAHLLGGPETVMGALADDLGVETCAVPGNRMGLALKGRILTSGKAETYPLRLPLSLAGRLSFIRAGIKLRRITATFLRAFAEEQAGRPAAMAQFRARYGPVSVAQYLGRLHPDVHGIFSAITERVAAPPEDLSIAACASLFAMVWGGADKLARNVVGGSARLPEAIAQRIGNRMMLDATVVSVEEEGGSVRVVYRTGHRETVVRARHAIVATPAHVTHGIVRGLTPETEAALAWLPYGAFYCAAILTDETGPMPWDDVYALALADRSFGMLFNHANVVRAPGRRERGGSLMVYAGGERARALFDLSDGEIRERFLADLYDLYPEARGIVREVVIQRWQNAVPFARPGRHALQGALEAPQGRVHLAGDYFAIAANMEMAATTGQRAAAAVEAELKAVSAPVPGG